MSDANRAKNSSDSSPMNKNNNMSNFNGLRKQYYHIYSFLFLIFRLLSNSKKLWLVHLKTKPAYGTRASQARIGILVSLSWCIISLLKTIQFSFKHTGRFQVEFWRILNGLYRLYNIRTYSFTRWHGVGGLGPPNIFFTQHCIVVW